MAILRFGHTWWGNKWLGALNAIDYSNRLPRGEQYARNGSVRSIEIEGNIIKARVKGRQPSPYIISMALKTFKQKDKEAIHRIISTDPYYLSQLESRNLP